MLKVSYFSLLSTVMRAIAYRISIVMGRKLITSFYKNMHLGLH